MRASSSQWSSCYNHQPRRVEGFPENYANPCSLLTLPPYPSRQGRTFPTFSVDPSKSTPTPITQSLPPLVVVGSANADIYVEIDRLPKEGETISASSGQTLAGGKGANQAACGGRLSYPTYFIGQVGEDAHGSLVRTALEGGGVNLGYCSVVDGVPTGHAVVMLQPDGQNSIIIVGGANTTGWPDVLPDEDLGFIKSAGIVLLQREIPDSVNIQVAKASASGFTAESCALWGLFCELGMLSVQADIICLREGQFLYIEIFPAGLIRSVLVSQGCKECWCSCDFGCWRCGLPGTSRTAELCRCI